MTNSARVALGMVAAVIVFSVPGSAQKTTGPKARYEMDVQTTSGFGMGAMMGGGGLGSLLGGGGGSNYSLEMRLNSANSAPKQPETADHFFLPGAKMGKSVPLIGGVPGETRAVDRQPTEEELKRDRPKGRILMFWGCYDKAPKGQPFIIDFAKMPTYKLPPEAQMQRVAPRKQRDNNAAWWPNDKSGKQPKSGSTLRGEHRVASLYTPEIRFSLANDYMAALNVDAGDKGAAIGLGWNSVAMATGYSAWAVGGMDRAGSGGDLIFWSSANNRDQNNGMGWLSPSEVQRQIGLKNIMPPSQTSCSIPAEAKAAANGMMFGGLQAHGPEENFAFPPKPADPKAVWNIEWTAKARFQSMASFMTGMPGMGGRGGMGGGDGADGPPTAPKKKKPCKGPFGVPIPGSDCS